MIAIIETGGKQYQVAMGTKLKVEKIEKEVGDVVTFTTLCLGDENTLQLMSAVKTPVEAKILSHGKHEEVKGIRHKAKKRQLTRYGHRQPYTEIEITKLSA